MVPLWLPFRVGPWPGEAPGRARSTGSSLARLWAGTIEIDAGAGRRSRKVVKAKLKKDVLAKMRAIRANVDAGLPVPNQTATTGAWLTWWATETLPTTVKPSTVISYRQILADYVVPNVGTIALVRLTPEHVEAMMAALTKRGLSPRTVAYSRAVLRRALGVALKRGRVTRNVAALVDAPPKAASKLDDALDATGAAAVLRVASRHRLEALAVLVLAVGLRQGEALDLRWTDVDLDARTITVIKAKTAAGERTVALPPFVVTALRAHRARQLAERLAADYWPDPDLVFASTVGTGFDKRNVLRWWHALTLDAGVGRRRFHSSRHTAATLMLNAGVPLEVVPATLGHAGLAITADVYAKVRPELQRSAADAMEGLLGLPPSPGAPPPAR